MAEKPEVLKYEVSRDGKTVKVGGQSYSLDAFKRQFTGVSSYYRSGEFGRVGELGPRDEGTVKRNPNAPKVVVVKDDQAAPKRSRRQAKKNAKSIAIMNENLRNRKEGGITSSGGKKNVNPVYRNIGRGGGLGGLFGKLPK